MKTLTMKNPWDDEDMKVCFRVSKYANNERLYVGILCLNDEYQFWEPWCDVTVNLSDEDISSENCAFVDTNNAPYISQWLQDNGIAKFVGEFGFSGFCAYPMMEFDVDKVNEYKY